MKLKPHQRVDLETAKARALAYLTKHRFELVAASSIAGAIWPDSEMKAQGAGAAASRILKRLEADGRARWTVRGSGRNQHWGWTLVFKADQSEEKD